jgi:hypothetical protein
MNEQQFLHSLQQTAKQQAAIPSSHNRLTTFFWRHAWLWWLVAGIITAWLYELWQGRCSL